MTDQSYLTGLGFLCYTGSVKNGHSPAGSGLGYESISVEKKMGRRGPFHSPLTYIHCAICVREESFYAVDLLRYDA